MHYHKIVVIFSMANEQLEAVKTFGLYGTLTIYIS